MFENAQYHIFKIVIPERTDKMQLVLKKIKKEYFSFRVVKNYIKARSLTGDSKFVKFQRKTKNYKEETKITNKWKHNK